MNVALVTIHATLMQDVQIMLDHMTVNVFLDTKATAMHVMVRSQLYYLLELFIYQFCVAWKLVSGILSRKLHYSRDKNKWLFFLNKMQIKHY